MVLAFVRALLSAVAFAVELLLTFFHMEGMKVFVVGSVEYLSGVSRRFGFGSGSTGVQVAQRFAESLKGQCAIVTGATSGIGLETARALAQVGCHVVMAVRNTDKAKSVIGQLVAANTKKAKAQKRKAQKLSFEVRRCDLSDLSSVRAFAAQLLADQYPATILINNAGIAFVNANGTKDGFESQFGTNYLGHALLTEMLLPLLHSNAKKLLSVSSKSSDISAVTTSKRRKSRIVNVASVGHAIVARKQKLDWRKIAHLHQSDDYSAYFAYGYSKLANILHARFVARQITEARLSVSINALHPGSIMTTGLTQHKMDGAIGVEHLIEGLFLKTAAQGSATSLLVAAHPFFDNVNGRYLVDCDFGYSTPQANDDSLANELQKFTKETVFKTLRKMS